MADIEKVLLGLEHCSDRTNRGCNHKCPYFDRYFCESELAADALELLKIMKEEQERRMNNGSFD